MNAPGRSTRGRLAAALGLAAVLVAALALAAVLVAAPPAAAAVRAAGEKVRVSGLVTGPDGLPLAGVRVVLEASRSRFSLRRLTEVDSDTIRVAGLTDARGEYSLEWPWNGYYNRFELVVGVPVRKRGGERLHELARRDLTREVRRAGPVVATLVVEDAAFVRTLESFLASIDSDDERRVYRDQGKPDEVKRREYAGSGRVDASWWYFETGQVYRFENGVLRQVERFDPVKEF